MAPNIEGVKKNQLISRVSITKKVDIKQVQGLKDTTTYLEKS